MDKPSIRYNVKAGIIASFHYQTVEWNTLFSLLYFGNIEGNALPLT